nr:hypothetical protein [Evansella caseinilytica]
MDDLGNLFHVPAENKHTLEKLTTNKFKPDGVGVGSGANFSNAASGAGNVLDNIKIIDGKVGGKIPVDDFKEIRKASLHNVNSDSMTLGKYTPTIEQGVENWAKPGPDSYIKKAGGNSTYFDLGSEWSNIQKKYNLTNDEMFEYFNVPALDDAVSRGKVIKFSHDPRLYPDSYLSQEWQYLKETHGFKTLKLKGDVWIAK